MKRSLFLFLPVLMAAGCSSSSNDDSLRPKAVQKEVDCDAFRKALPAGYVANFADVPEIPGDNSSAHLKIFYYYKSPLQGRVTLFLNGGPGGSSQGSFKVMESALRDFGYSDQMTFVYMDQRGTGCSSDYPTTGTTKEGMEHGKWYGTRGIVNDAEVIRQALVGARPWSIFGQSYGAMIAHRYALLAPKSLDRVVAYANTITPDNGARMRDRVESQFDVWNSYFNAYPDDRSKVAVLIETLSMNVCVQVMNEKACGVELADPLVSYYLGFHDAWPKLHVRLGLLVVDGVFQISQASRLANAFAEPGSYQRTEAIGAVNYFDRDVLPYDADHCAPVRADWVTHHADIPFESFITECSAALQLNYHSKMFDYASWYFSGQHDTMGFADLRNVLALKPKNFFLLYSADLDPWVPVRSFAPEVQALGDVLTYRNFTDVGHDGYFTKREVFQDLLAQ